MSVLKIDRQAIEEAADAIGKTPGHLELGRCLTPDAGSDLVRDSMDQLANFIESTSQDVLSQKSVLARNMKSLLDELALLDAQVAFKTQPLRPRASEAERLSDALRNPSATKGPRLY